MSELATWTPRTEASIVNYQDAAVQRLGEWAHSADAAYSVAERLATSSFVPAQFKGKPVELTAAILAGMEVGLSPMTAMRSFDIISGQAAPRAITLRAVVQSYGHEMVLVESTSTRCKMKGRRRGSSDWQTVTWTIERAQSLSLTGKDNWKKQPAAMLIARATSELARLIASDAILGIGYSVEEIADGAGDDEPYSAEPAPVRVMSRRPQAVPEPTEDEAPESPLLNTSGALAKRMFATMNEKGIRERDDRLAFVSSIVGREVESSSDMTDADAELVIDALAGLKDHDADTRPSRASREAEGQVADVPLPDDDVAANDPSLDGV